MKKFAVGAACAAAALVPATAHATPQHFKRTCANKLCTHDRAGVSSCARFDGMQTRSRCYIKRAARHYRQPESVAVSIAFRESRLNPHATNSSSGAAGLYQFMPTTWAHTPYKRHSPYEARWASLAAMWLWAHGGYHHWSL